MKRLLATTVFAVCLALPAAAAANPQYWGGPMEDLPAADITYKVNSHGVVRDIGISVKLKCRYEGGKNSPNSRLGTGFARPRMTATGFRDHYHRPFHDDGFSISQRIKGTVSDSLATGKFRARLKSRDLRHPSKGIRICHSGRQHWRATPLSFSEWKKLRGAPFRARTRLR